MTQQISKHTNYTTKPWQYSKLNEIGKKISKPHITPQVNMEKRAGGVGSGRVKWVVGQNGSFLNGSIGLRVN